ncbi:unnamed protein product [Caenorhabditis brenneri]
MDVPDLLKIAARKIAYYIIEEKYPHVDYPILSQLACNYIFQLVKEVRFRLDEQKLARIDEVLMKVLCLSEVDLNDQHYSNIFKKDLELIKTQNLFSLGLGDAVNIREYRVEKDPRMMRRVHRAGIMPNNHTDCDPIMAQYYFDIVKLLEENLTPETKQKLISLDLSKYIRPRSEFPFTRNWTQSIGQMLPALCSLSVIGQNLEGDEFLRLCVNFPNLRKLNISKTGVTNLRGIANLKFLQDLSIGGLVMVNKNCIDELFELPDLKKLSMSGQYKCNCCRSNTIKFFAESDKVIQKLELFDCTLTNTTDPMLRRIVERHPTLKRIVANYSSVRYYSPHGVEIWNNLSLHSFLCSIRYFREVRNSSMICRILFNFLDFIHMTELEDLNEVDMRETVHELYSLIRQYEYHHNILEQVDIFCANMSEENKIHFYSLYEKRLLIDSFLFIKEVAAKRRLNIYPSWKFLNNVLETVEQCDADRVASLAMQSIIADYPSSPTPECIRTVDLVLDRIDSTSHHYKALNKYRLIYMLGTVRDHHTSDQADRLRAKRILEFTKNSFPLNAS